MVNRRNRITYLSNAGVMLELHDKKILVDVFCNSTIPLYKNPPAEIKEQMILGVAPFDNVDILLFTHHHTDHFDPVSTAHFSEHNPRTIIISTPEVISQLYDQSPNIEKDRLIKSNAFIGTIENIQINGVGIQSVSMLHDGKDYGGVHNFAYLIDVEGIKILHVGDAKPIKENYINLNLPHMEIDLLIVPFPYIGIPTGRQLIEKYIKPKKIAAIHLPYREFDSNRWIDITMKNYLKVKDDYIETVFLEEIGDYIIV